MRHKLCVVSIIACAVLGLLRALDLVFLSESGTNFVTVSSVWLRYAVLAVAIVAFYVIFQKIAKSKKDLQALNLNSIIMCALGSFAVATSIFAMLYAVNELNFPTTNFGHFQSSAFMLLFAFGVRSVFAVSLFLFGVFCSTVGVKNKKLEFKKSTLRVIGFLGAVSFCFLCTLRYAESPASVHRITNILSVCSALSALVFYTKLIGVMYKKPSAKVSNDLVCSGLTAFLLCTCIELPQTLFLMGGAFNLYTLLMSVTTALLGVLGAHTALKVCADSNTA